MAPTKTLGQINISAMVASIIYAYLCDSFNLLPIKCWFRLCLLSHQLTIYILHIFGEINNNHTIKSGLYILPECIKIYPFGIYPTFPFVYIFLNIFPLFFPQIYQIDIALKTFLGAGGDGWFGIENFAGENER